MGSPIDGKIEHGGDQMRARITLSILAITITLLPGNVVYGDAPAVRAVLHKYHQKHAYTPAGLVLALPCAGFDDGEVAAGWQGDGGRL